MKYISFFIFLSFIFINDSFAKSNNVNLGYKKPKSDIWNIVKAPRAPFIIINEQKTRMLKVYYNSMPSIKYISRPIVKLGGKRFNPKNRSRNRSYFYTKIVVQDLKSNGEKEINFGNNPILNYPYWSPNGDKLAVTIEKNNCTELWFVDANTARPVKIKNICMNTILGSGIQWLDNNRIIVRARTKQKKIAFDNNTPQGPRVEESTKKKSQNRTYKDLLKNENDSKMFNYYLDSQLKVVNLKNGSVKNIGKHGIFTRYSISPNKKLLIVDRIKRPFSYVVPYYYFAKNIELWNLKGKVVNTFAKLPVFDSIPIRGVPTGPRDIEWVPNKPATLFYSKALDKGDHKVKAKFRDQLVLAKISKNNKIKEKVFFKTKNRFSGITWLNDGSGDALVYDYDRDKKWVKGLIVNTDKENKSKVLWDYSINDSYNKPGKNVLETNEIGQEMLAVDKIGPNRYIYTYGKGATSNGDYPYLKRWNLSDSSSKELFRAKKGSYERFIGFADENHNKIVTKYETKIDFPNYYVTDILNNVKKKLTNEKNPSEVFGKIKKEIIKYSRADGVKLSGILYYPINYKKGKRYPTVIKAYPRQYNSAKMAGQVRGSSNKYSMPYRSSHLYFVLRGYAVLDKAQMPVVGGPETMNDTFVEQLVDSSKATIDALVKKGITDKKRVGVIGHSYGAFMVANLLTHTDLYKAGIARSGAYNRSLTPFGFQNEVRTFWEAKNTYLKVSPFMNANKIKHPILLIHGAIDNNSGTHTIQSERYFSAIKGNGGTARMVLLPNEGHSYAALESVGHVLWEMFRWFDLYL